MPDESPIAPRRRSACADAALRTEIDRVNRMTIEERVKAALSMPERFSWLVAESPSPNREDDVLIRKQRAGR
jgi:hypothetical protein